MAAEASEGVGEDDEEELCRVLQAHAKMLEQREMSQMRQGAILQRKLDAAEQQLRELRVQQSVGLEETARTLRVKEQARSTENEQRVKEAASVLQLELDAGDREAKDAERSLRGQLQSAQGRRGHLQTELEFWRRCGHELLQDSEREQSVAKDATAADRVKELHQDLSRLASEVAALRRSCGGLEKQIEEVEKIAHASVLEEAQVQQRCQALRLSVADVEAVGLKSREQAASELQQEQALRAEAVALDEQLLRDKQALAQRETSGSIEEVTYLRRKFQEREKEVAHLQQEHSRLQSALHRHAGPAIQQREEPGLDSNYSGSWGAFDEKVSKGVTMLFKSIFVRRLFCGHLFVLYSWLFFLLWWMSGGAITMR